MSADILRTQPARERLEPLTQAQLLARLDEVQDRLYDIDQMLRGLCAWAAAHDGEAAKPPVATRLS